jgi:hypothetical protein
MFEGWKSSAILPLLQSFKIFSTFMLKFWVEKGVKNQIASSPKISWEPILNIWIGNEYFFLDA